MQSLGKLLVKRKKTGGTWDPKDRNLYFLVPGAEGIMDVIHPCHRDILVAVNNIGGERFVAKLEAYCTHGDVRLLLDSGTYALVSEISRVTGEHQSVLFARPAHTHAGFDELMKAYVALVKRLEPAGLWGYIELDFGGVEGKTAVRKELEDMGLRPIPVFHPLADPPEYFDRLAEEYDRVAFGGIVGLPRPTKMRVIATMHAMREKHPKCWVHALGIDPSDVQVAYPMDSCDSSGWLTGMRWGTNVAKAANVKLSDMPGGYLHRLGVGQDTEGGAVDGWQFGAYVAHHNGLVWKGQLAEMATL